MSHGLRLHSTSTSGGVYVVAEVPGVGIVLATGATVPSDAELGFAPGCLFIQNDGSTEATIWYANVGTLASANFDAVDLNVAEAAYLSGITLGTAAVSKVLSLAANGNLNISAGNVSGLRTTASTTAVAITGATAIVLGDSGGIFTVSQAAAYDIDLPSPTTGPGLRYFFSLTAPGANNVTLTVLGGAATFVGSITIDGATIVATGSTLTFATGASSLGDSIEIQSIATNLYHVRAISSTAGGITIA